MRHLEGENDSMDLCTRATRCFHGMPHGSSLDYAAVSPSAYFACKWRTARKPSLTTLDCSRSMVRQRQRLIPTRRFIGVANVG